MGMRRRTRRRALVAGAAIGHHEAKKNAQYAQDQDQYQDQGQYEEQAPPPPEPAQYAPAPVDPYAEIDHLAALHASGALTDEEFASEKAKVLGTS